MSVPTRRILEPIFGEPTLEAGGDGKATWSRSLTPGTQRVAWAAKLDAGTQTSWNDYAKVIVPVSEVPFTDLKSVRLESKYGVAVGADMAVCVYMHDPNDFDQHIELSHTPLTNVGAGYRELNYPTDIPGSSWGWYGNVTDTPDLCPLDWDSASYTWAQFQADKVFKTWTIYRISFDYGYQTGSIVLNDGYLCQAQINGVQIPIRPSVEEMLELIRGTGAVYINSDTAGADGARRFETITKRLRDAYLLVTTQDQKFGDATSQDYTVAADASINFRHIDISTLYFKNATGGQNGTVTILGTEE